MYSGVLGNNFMLYNNILCVSSGFETSADFLHTVRNFAQAQGVDYGITLHRLTHHETKKKEVSVETAAGMACSD